jgi:O-antigen/teichoic acid export membrane protein
MTVLGSPVFSAWTIPLVLLVAITNAFVFLSFLKSDSLAKAENDGAGWREIAQYFGWDYIGTAATSLSNAVSRLLVLNIAGAAALAGFHLAWTVAYSLILAAHSLSASLIAEGAAKPGGVRALAAKAILHGVLILGVVSVILFGLAPFIMSMFGASYADDSAQILRVLTVANLPGAVIIVFIAVARLQGHMRMVAAVQTSMLILMVTLGFLLTQSSGASGMAWAWLVINFATLAVIALNIYRQNGPGHYRGWSNSLAQAARSQFKLFSHTGSSGTSGSQAVPKRDKM